MGHTLLDFMTHNNQFLIIQQKVCLFDKILFEITKQPKMLRFENDKFGCLKNELSC